jgi:hypothetical protein
MTPELDLVEEVTRRIPLPVDALEITAVLESLGITDNLARRRYGAFDAFDLAEHVHTSMRASIAAAASTPNFAAPPTGRIGVTPLRPSAWRAWAIRTALAMMVVGLVLLTFGTPLAVPATRAARETTAQALTSYTDPSPNPPSNSSPPIAEHEVPAAEIPALVPLAKPGSGSMALRAVQPPSRVVLDEHFDEYSRAWPDDPRATAWLAHDGYRLSARQPGRFVAVGAQLGRPTRDVIVTATFRKVGGPPGGGYGLIVRDQGPGPRDGLHQGGRYYVLGAADVGDVGIWLREDDRWVDLVPWQRSGVVRVERNEVQAQALGQQLTLLVNGTAVASVRDASAMPGDVGIFVGGDGNEVVLERLLVALPAG